MCSLELFERPNDSDFIMSSSTTSQPTRNRKRLLEDGHDQDVPNTTCGLRTSLILPCLGLVTLGFCVMLVSLYIKQQHLANEVRLALARNDQNVSYSNHGNDGDVSVLQETFPPNLLESRSSTLLHSLLQYVNSSKRVVVSDSDFFVRQGLADDNIRLEHREFLPRLTVRALEELLELLVDLTYTMLMHNGTYFIKGRTLLGSYRHHGIIPWDNAVFLAANASQMDVLLANLHRLDARHKLRQNKFKLVLIYNLTSTDDATYGSTITLSIHITFFHENTTHIWDTSTKCAHGLSNSDYVTGDTCSPGWNAIRKSLVFPTHLRPFHSTFLSAPRDTFAYLRKTTRDDRCIARNTAMPCKLLKHIYQFVHRSPVISGVRETLMKTSGGIIHSLLVDEPRYAVCRPYTLRLVGSRRRQHSKSRHRIPGKHEIMSTETTESARQFDGYVDGTTPEPHGTHFNNSTTGGA
jgi:hypothetical protein